MSINLTQLYGPLVAGWPRAHAVNLVLTFFFRRPKATNTALCEAGTRFFVGGGLVKALKNAEATAVARIFRQLVPLG